MLTALGQHPEKPFLIKVGAAKPVGMGSLEVEVRRVELLGDIRSSGRAGAGMQLLEGDALKEQMAGWITLAEQKGLLQTEALEDLWAILREVNLSRPSPEEPY